MLLCQHYCKNGNVNKAYLNLNVHPNNTTQCQLKRQSERGKEVAGNV